MSYEYPNDRQTDPMLLCPHGIGKWKPCEQCRAMVTPSSPLSEESRVFTPEQVAETDRAWKELLDATYESGQNGWLRVPGTRAWRAQLAYLRNQANYGLDAQRRPGAGMWP